MDNIFTDQNFEKEVLKADTPVLVDFFADWCAPCKMIAPVIKDVTEEFEGKLKVGKLNVDENPAMAQKYGVMSIPTLLVFKDGVVVEQLVGAHPKQVLEEKVKRILASEG